MGTIWEMLLPPGRTSEWVMVLLDAAIKGAIILVLTGMVTVLMRKASAATRHLAWFLGLMSLVLVPVLSVALPAWHLPFLPKLDMPTEAVAPRVTGRSTASRSAAWPEEREPSTPSSWKYSPATTGAEAGPVSRRRLSWPLRAILVDIPREEGLVTARRGSAPRASPLHRYTNQWGLLFDINSID